MLYMRMNKNLKHLFQDFLKQLTFNYNHVCWFQAPNYTSTEYKVDLGSSSKWNYKMTIQPSITKKPEPRIVNQRALISLIESDFLAVP